MKRQTLVVCLVLLAWVLAPRVEASYYLDTPHNGSNGMDCTTCHSLSVFSIPNYNPDYHGSPTDPIGKDWTTRSGANPEDTLANNVCLECHGEGSSNPLKGPAKVVHSSRTTGSAKTWSTNCTQCHDAHFQGQLDWCGPGSYAANLVFLATGEFETANGRELSAYNAVGNYTTIGIKSTITARDSSWSNVANWKAKGGRMDGSRAIDGSRGLVLVPSLDLHDQTYEIIDVTPNAAGYLVLKVKGNMDATEAYNTGLFGVIYGQSIKSSVMPNGGSAAGDYRDVKFFEPGIASGTSGGFVDETAGSSSPKGLCQVCHTSTSVWRGTTTAAGHYADTNCGSCHNILNGGGSPVVANAGGPYVIDQGAGVTLGGGANIGNSCPDGVSNYWDLDNSGTYDVMGGGINGGMVNLTWAQLGTYGLQTVGVPHTINLQVRNVCDGTHAEATTTLTVYTNTPVANFTVTPNPALSGQAVSFDGSSSSHGRPGRSIVSYAWAYGDGATGTGVTASHVYAAAGAYSATLTVTDNNVPTKTASKTITVNVSQANQAADSGGPYVLNQGTGVTLHGGATFANACPDGVSNYWDLDNNGTYDVVGSGMVGGMANVSWAQLGTYGLHAVGVPHTIKLQVRNGCDGTHAEASTTLTVNNIAPVAEAGTDQNVSQGNLVTLNGGASSDSGGDPLTYSWSFTSVPGGSGAALTGAATVNPTFTVDVAGMYVAQLIVNDGRVGSVADTVTVTAYNNTPVASFTVTPNPALSGQSVSFDASSSTHGYPGRSIVSYAWAYGDGATGTGVTASHVYAAAGAYSATLTVTDNNVPAKSASKTITVNVSQASQAAESGGPYVLNQGAGVTLHGGATFATACLDGLSNYWDLDNNGTYDVSGPGFVGGMVNMSWVQLGTYGLQAAGVPHTIKLQVRNGCDGSHAEASTTLTVNNIAPVAEAGADQTVSQGNLVTLNGGASSDIGGDPLTYNWSLVSKPAGSSASLTGAATVSPTFTPDVAGVYVAQLIVNDGRVGSVADTVTVTVYNNTPVANFTATPNPALSGQSVNFDGTGSSHGNPGRSIVNYAWAYGDGATGNGVTASHVYASAGAYSATLTVTDNNVPTKSASKTITVNVSQINQAADSGGPYVINQGTGVTLRGGATFAAACPDGVSNYWDLDNNGTYDVSGPGFTGGMVNLSWVQLGTYGLQAVGVPHTIKLQVRNGCDGSHAEATTTLTVNNVAPVAEAGADQSVSQGNLVTLNGGASSDIGGDPLTYSWSLVSKPAGSSAALTGATTASPIFTPDVAGVYVAQLIVNDGRVGSAADTVTVTAYNNTPVANFTATPNPALSGQSVNFDGTGSSHGNPGRSIVNYAWAYGDGATGNGVTASHVYAAAGAYSATLTVTDNNVPAKSASKTITVNVEQGGHQATHFAATGTSCTDSCHFVPATGVVEGIHKNICTSCHINALGGTGTSILGPAANGVDGDARLGVSAAPHAAITCLTCHPVATYPTGTIHHDTTNSVNGNCITCHAQGTSHGGDHSTRVSASPTNCNSACHPSAPVVGTPTGIPVSPATDKVHNACTTCHRIVGSAVTQNTTTSKAPLRPVNGGNCDACHGAYFPAHTHPGHAASVKVNSVTTPPTANCVSTGCHVATTAPFVGNGQVHLSCTSCHAPGTATIQGSAIGHITGGECITCHTSYFNGHLSHTATGTSHAVLVRATDLYMGTICNSCHTMQTNDWAGICSLHSGGCSMCHDSTRTTNVKTGYPSVQAVIQDDTLDAAKIGCLDCHANIHISPGTISLSAASYSVLEGGTLTITATRTGGSDGPVSVHYATANGTATAGSDYTATSGTLSWDYGDTTSKTFIIPITQDAVVENNESFNITLSNPTGGAVIGTPSAAVVTIIDDDTATPGTISWSPATYSVSEGGASLTLIATRTGGSTGPVGVSWATANGTASAGLDYYAANGILSWANGETSSKTITLGGVIIQDTLVEGNETFYVNMSNPTGGATLGGSSTAVVTIVDDDVTTPGTIFWSPATYSVSEGGTVTLTATRTGGSNSPVSVGYATTNGTATAGRDYPVTSGALSWDFGDTTSKSVIIPITLDALVEGNETFSITLSNPTGGATLGTPSSAVVTIVDVERFP